MAASLAGDIRVGVLEAALNCKLSLDYQVLRIFQDLNTTLNDGGKGDDKGYDTSYKIEAGIQEIIQGGSFLRVSSRSIRSRRPNCLAMNASPSLPPPCRF